MSNENPCKECETRYIGCHDSCFRYGKWKEKRNEMKRRQQEEYEKDIFLYDVRFKRKKK